jgi:signal transduction histidine kinase
VRQLTDGTPGGHRHDAGAPAWLTQSMPVDRTRTFPARLRVVLPPVLILALAVGYFGADLIVGLPASAVQIPVSIAAGLVALQALALLFRTRAPVLVFAAVVLLDGALLLTSGGELGTGALAVMVATYALLRDGETSIRYPVVLCGAVVTLIGGAIAMAAAATFSVPVIVALVIARPVLQYAVPAAFAEFFLARQRLVQALRERAELAERQRLRDVEREIAGVRTAMARELHDIAAHHLSGIIVGAQAASVLVESDPDRTRAMLRTVQQDARTTLADLRRTVGLLRADGETGADLPAPVPSLDRVAQLVDTARRRGQSVDLDIDGVPTELGPLAETAGYRMVQESLANAARHAAGAPSRVRIQYRSDSVRITVQNAAPPDGPGPAPVTPGKGGYGISGMRERADLVGATLSIDRLADGGWRTLLDIPRDTQRST